MGWDGIFWDRIVDVWCFCFGGWGGVRMFRFMLLRKFSSEVFIVFGRSFDIYICFFGCLYCYFGGLMRLL